MKYLSLILIVLALAACSSKPMYDSYGNEISRSQAWSNAFAGLSTSYQKKGPSYACETRYMGNMAYTNCDGK